MNRPQGNRTIWIVVAVTALIIAVVAFALLSNDEDAANTDTQQQTQSESEEAVSDTSLLASGLQGDASIYCSYEYEDGSDGEIYARNDSTFRVNQSSVDGEFRMIKLEDYAYIWTEGEAEGIMADASAWEEEYKETVPVFRPEAFEENSEANNVQCEERGSFDESLFTPPESVTFQDFTQFENFAN